jgi:hypothetical protein
MTWFGRRRSKEERQIRAYLLGTINEASKAAVEERMFDDEEYHALLQDVRNDLFDDWARRRLDKEDRRRFEERLLGPAAQDVRANLAEALAVRQGERTAADPAPRRLSPRLAAAFASVALLACVAAGWLAMENRNLRGQLQATRAQPVSREPATPPTPTGPAPAIARLTLTPQIARGAEPVQTLPAPDPAALVRVELIADEIRQTYLVTIEAAGRGRVWSQTAAGRTPEGTVILWLPGEVLHRGDYELLLYSAAPGKELLGSYIFRIAGR